MREPRVAILLLLLGCFGGPPGPPPDLSAGVEIVESEGIAEFYERAAAFYDRMAQRRFNTLATYEDTVLRRYFKDVSAFSDYYADLASDLAEAHFEKSRAVSLSVEEVLVDGPGQARVKVRIVGRNALPLRRRAVVLQREDRWERVGGNWWIVPGRL
ncbi:MAG: hypothetical protein ABFS46_04695 [Myxococcota bacterium]